MPTTRSADKQTRVEDVGAGSQNVAKSKSADTKAGNKRKAHQTISNNKKAKFSDEVPTGGSKTATQSNTEDTSAAEDEKDAININRAPVLELWASCVAQFLHPQIPWETCLSVGKSIATITAVSKGRSIGTMDKPDPGEAQKKRVERRQKAEKEELDEIEVMSFHLNLKNGLAMVGDKPTKAGEDALTMKYGGAEQYARFRATFQDALEQWKEKEKEEELDKQAFHMYEDFRPSIPKGQKGWGRKGQLRLDTIKSVVGGV